MSNKFYDNEVADDLISEGAERVRQEALRQLRAFDIDDDDARMQPLPQTVPPSCDKWGIRRT